MDKEEGSLVFLACIGVAGVGLLSGNFDLVLLTIGPLIIAGFISR